MHPPAPQFFQNYQIFLNFTALSENFWTSAVGKDKDSEFYWKIFELSPPPFSTGAMASLSREALSAIQTGSARNFLTEG